MHSILSWATSWWTGIDYNPTHKSSWKKILLEPLYLLFSSELICGFTCTAFGCNPSFAQESLSTKGCKAYSLRKVPHARVVSETWDSFFGMDIGRNWQPSCMSLCNIMLRINYILFTRQRQQVLYSIVRCSEAAIDEVSALSQPEHDQNHTIVKSKVLCVTLLFIDAKSWRFIILVLHILMIRSIICSDGMLIKCFVSTSFLVRLKWEFCSYYCASISLNKLIVYVEISGQNSKRFTLVSY